MSRSNASRQEEPRSSTWARKARTSNPQAEEALAAVGAGGVGGEQSLGDELAEGGLVLAEGALALLAVVKERVDGAAAGPAEEQGAESGEEKSWLRHECAYRYAPMKATSISKKTKVPADAAQAALRHPFGKLRVFRPFGKLRISDAFEQCRQALCSLEWISEGSVSANHPGTWRWTRKVAGKTVTVALSDTQARAFRQAIAEHRRLKKLLQEMRALSQEALLQTIPGPTPRPPKKRPKSALS